MDASNAKRSIPVNVDAVEPIAKVGLKTIKYLAKDSGSLKGIITGGSTC